MVTKNSSTNKLSAIGLWLLKTDHVANYGPLLSGYQQLINYQTMDNYSLVTKISSTS
jgi:hypothetical protein